MRLLHPLLPPSLSHSFTSKRHASGASAAAIAAWKAKTNSATGGVPINRKGLSPLVRITRIGGVTMKTWKPITPSIRHQKRVYNPHLWKGEPLKVLTIPKKSTGGRNNLGKNVTRGRGGGHKRRIRLVDFFRHEPGKQRVLRIEYDPGRTGHIALIKHEETNNLSYIIAPVGLREGDIVQSFRSGLPDEFLAAEERERRGIGVADHSPDDSNAEWRRIRVTEAEQQVRGRGQSEYSVEDVSMRVGADIVLPDIEMDEMDSKLSSPTLTPTDSSPSEPQIQDSPLSPPTKRKKGSPAPLLDLGALRTHALHPGNVLPLKYIPVGTHIHAICLHPRGRASLARSAGAFAEIVSGGDSEFVHVRMSSGEVRKIKGDCCGTIGEVSNPDHKFEILGKAGRARWLGRRPKVRGVAMNKVDHPHGGGRGKSKSNKHPQSATGVLKFQPTRRPGSKKGNKLVVIARPRGKEKRGRKR